MEGRLVSLKESVKSFQRILAGEFDHLPENAFYMVRPLFTSIFLVVDPDLVSLSRVGRRHCRCCEKGREARGRNGGRGRKLGHTGDWD